LIAGSVAGCVLTVTASSVRLDGVGQRGGACGDRCAVVVVVVVVAVARAWSGGVVRECSGLLDVLLPQRLLVARAGSADVPHAHRFALPSPALASSSRVMCASP
jgi:hypothetical protein